MTCILPPKEMSDPENWFTGKKFSETRSKTRCLKMSDPNNFIYLCVLI